MILIPIIIIVLTVEDDDVEQKVQIGAYAFSSAILLAIFLFGMPVRYIFASDYLLIKSGLLRKRKIFYSQIKSYENYYIQNIKRSNDSDEAITSADCIKIYIYPNVKTKYIFSKPIEITIGKDYFLVSPKHKKDFIEELKFKLAECCIR